MILTFEVENFRSFGRKAQLELLHPSMKTNIPRGGADWLDVTNRVAALFGPNASGKSTVLEAILALSRAMRSPGYKLHQPHRGDQFRTSPTRYSIGFVASDNTRYDYEVIAQPWGVSSESLHSYPRGSRRLLFERSQEGRGGEIVFKKGSSLKGPSAEVFKILKPRALYLATALRFDHPYLSPIARAIAHGVGVRYISFRDKQDHEVLMRVVMEMVAAPQVNEVLTGELLKAADLGIEKFEVQKQEIPPEVRDQIKMIVEALSSGSEDESEEFGEVPEVRDVLSFTHRGADGDSFELPVTAESAGTITWMTTAWHVLDALRKGTTLVVDELDASLHPALVRYLVSLFSSGEMNHHGAQLIFTSHDVTLLGNLPTRLLAPAEAWFVEKDADSISELYCLDDFDNRPGNNSQKRYLTGAFGALPDIDAALVRRFLEQFDPRDSGV